MPEGPHDADGFYTCDCGRDRHGKPYNRRSVMHAHGGERRTTFDDIIDGLLYIRRRYGSPATVLSRRVSHS
jgi:hypothetical protein